MKIKLFKDRMQSQDIAKGLAIILVTLVHSVKVNNIVGSAIGVLFGYIMPFFLFMSGYNYKDKGLSLKENLKKRTIELLIPFLIISFGLFIIMGAYFYFVDGFTIKEICKSFLIFLMSKWSLPLIGWKFNQVMFQRILGPCWFIQFLIMANIIFIPCTYYVKGNNRKLFSTVALLSIVSAILIKYGVVLPWGIQDAPAIAALMLIANYLKNNDILFNSNISTKSNIINSIVCVAIIGFIQLNANGAGYFGAGELGGVQGGLEVYTFLLIGVIGSYLIINICKLFEKSEFLTKIFTWVGRNTFLILILHMSVVHIIKGIFGLPQWNAADGLFGKGDYREWLVYPLILGFTIVLVNLIRKLLIKLKIA